MLFNHEVGPGMAVDVGRDIERLTLSEIGCIERHREFQPRGQVLDVRQPSSPIETPGPQTGGPSAVPLPSAA